MTTRIQIVVDRREQQPYSFERYPVEVVPGTLHTGDYSVLGSEGRIAIERKSLSDLVGCLIAPKKAVKAARPNALIGRERFEAELARARSLERFLVVIEASEQAVLDHHYRSRMHPNAVLGSVAALARDYGHKFIWAVSRYGAEGVVFDTLAQWAQDQARTVPEELFG